MGGSGDAGGKGGPERPAAREHIGVVRQGSTEGQKGKRRPSKGDSQRGKRQRHQEGAARLTAATNKHEPSDERRSEGEQRKGHRLDPGEEKVGGPDGGGKVR